MVLRIAIKYEYSVWQSYVCSHLNGLKYRKWLNCPICPIDGTLTGTSRGSHGNEEVLNIPQIFRTGASPLDG